MVWIRELTEEERRERMHVRGLVEIAEEVLPEGAGIFPDGVSFHAVYKGMQIKRMENSGGEILSVSHPGMLKFAKKIAEAYEDFIGEEVMIKKSYGD